jgi:arginine N-succinyltransferase
MMIVRPVKLEDVDRVYALAAHSDTGLTTLPHDQDILKRRIEDSVASFKKNVTRPGGEVYFFVMEDTAKHKIVGTCSIVSKVGGYEPFYTYQVKTALKESKSLHVKKEIKYLQLIRDHNGPSEIGTLFLLPEYRHSGLGRLLSLSRFLFMAQHRQLFEEWVVAEMRGVIDEKGKSPFWEALGRYFFDVEFEKADHMVMSDKSFIADLMPEHPIYIPLLSKEAKDVIGVVHKDSAPAFDLLLKEGFEPTDEVDIFESGPVLRAKVAKVRSVRESRLGKVKDASSNNMNEPVYLLSNATEMKNYRVCLGNMIMEEEDEIKISRAVAETLHLKEGDQVRYVSFK